MVVKLNCHLLVKNVSGETSQLGQQNSQVATCNCDLEGCSSETSQGVVNLNAETMLPGPVISDRNHIQRMCKLHFNINTDMKNILCVELTVCVCVGLSWRKQLVLANSL